MHFHCRIAFAFGIQVRIHQRVDENEISGGAGFAWLHKKSPKLDIMMGSFVGNDLNDEFGILICNSMKYLPSLRSLNLESDDGITNVI